MLVSRNRLVPYLDLCVVSAVLAAVLLVPVFFIVPYNDEWLRINYLAEHSLWDWTVMHCQTWVVRPTAELIMGALELPLTRNAFGPTWNAAAFLARLHASYVLIALTTLALIYLIAALLACSLRCVAHAALGYSLLLICILMADGLGYAFYWVDGYANVIVPFLLLGLGLGLWSAQAWARGVGALVLVTAALGHEVVCIFVIGFVSLHLLLRDSRRISRRSAPLTAAMCLVCVAILLTQTFSAGPTLRAEVLSAKSGARFSVEGMWQALGLIDPLRWLVTYLASLFAIALYRPRLQAPLQRAFADYRAHPEFWWLLNAGTLLTSCLPLATIGLKKSKALVINTAGGIYSVSTLLFVILLAVLSTPLLADKLDPSVSWLRRHRASSLLLVLATTTLFSPNVASYSAAFTDFRHLRGQAVAYMDALFAGGDRVRVCRPHHVFSKVESTMTTRNAAQYFGIRKIKEVTCPD